MPGENEVLEYPRKYFLFAKFLATFFSRSRKFSNSSPNISDDLFSHSFTFFEDDLFVIYPNFLPFCINCQISRNFAPWMTSLNAALRLYLYIIINVIIRMDYLFNYRINFNL